MTRGSRRIDVSGSYDRWRMMRMRTRKDERTWDRIPKEACDLAQATQSGRSYRFKYARGRRFSGEQLVGLHRPRWCARARARREKETCLVHDSVKARMSLELSWIPLSLYTCVNPSLLDRPERESNSHPSGAFFILVLMVLPFFGLFGALNICFFFWCVTLNQLPEHSNFVRPVLFSSLP